MPTECGDLPFLIKRDGTWLYRGTPINRKELVCLFASVLRREEDGSWWLQTPAERGRIEVEDAPFVAVELDWTGDGRHQVLSFRTNIDEVVTAGPEHPIRVSHDLFTCEPTPYILRASWRGATSGGRGADQSRDLLRTGCPGGSGVGRQQAAAGRLEPGPVLLPGRIAARRGVTPAALRVRLAEIAAEPPDRCRLHGDEVAATLARAPVPAAVLVPVVLGEAPGILLTKRTSHLSAHAGQVSFPGGRIDPEDSGPEAAALREAWEEIGLDPGRWRCWGAWPTM